MRLPAEDLPRSLAVDFQPRNNPAAPKEGYSTKAGWDRVGFRLRIAIGYGFRPENRRDRIVRGGLKHRVSVVKTNGSVMVVPMTREITLQGTLYKPEGKGPFPAVLYNHWECSWHAAKRWRPRGKRVDC